MTNAGNKKSNYTMPFLLIFWSAIPVIAGGLRLVQLTGGPVELPDSTRILTAPIGPLIIHILSAIIYCWLGAFQFSQGIRDRWPKWHKGAGMVLIPAGLTAALSGLWLSHFFPAAENDNQLLYAFRMTAGGAMTISLLLGLSSIRQRLIFQHGAWMIRAYALGLGAGTQPFFIIVWMLAFGEPAALSRSWLFGSAWIFNLVIAEWIIYYPRKRYRGHGLMSSSLRNQA